MDNIINISDLLPHPLSLNADQDSDVTEVAPEEADFNYHCLCSLEPGLWMLSAFRVCADYLHGSAFIF